MIRYIVLSLIAAFAYLPSAHAQAPAVGGLLSADPGFENGFADWNQNWSGISSLNTTSPIAGTTSLVLGAAKGGRAQRIVNGIEAGAKYRVTGLARVRQAGDVGTIGIEFTNAAGVSILDQWIVVNSTSVQNYAFDLQIPAGTASLNFYAFKNVGTQPADFDDVALTKIANP